MFSYQRQTRVLAAAWGDHVELRALRPAGLNILSADIRGCASSVRDHLTLEVASELRDVFIVSVENGRPTVRKRFNQLVLRPGDAGERIEELQVYGSNVGDHADLWLRNLGQGANLTGVRHAHLDHGDVVFRFQLQQHEGQSEMIIEVAFGLEHSEPRAENMSDSLFGRGLAG